LVLSVPLPSLTHRHNTFTLNSLLVSLNSRALWVHQNPVPTRYQEGYMQTGLQEMVATHVACYLLCLYAHSLVTIKIEFHLQHTSSNIKLLRVSRQQPQSNKPSMGPSESRVLCNCAGQKPMQLSQCLTQTNMM